MVREKPQRPNPVIQIGDRIGTHTVNEINVYDPLAKAATEATRNERAGDHRLAFWANTSGGDMIVRATQTDNDEDGLFDHWESSGIDFNNDGTIDIALNAAPFSANPLHKDIFVEIDFMRMQGHTHRPGSSGLDRVRNAFSGANVSNPDGNLGITLHNMVDETLREPTQLISSTPSPTPIPSPIPFLSRAQGVRNDFFDFKNGEPHNPCGTQDDDGHFGRIADRQSPNCLNIIGGRRLVFM